MNIPNIIIRIETEIAPKNWDKRTMSLFIICSFNVLKFRIIPPKIITPDMVIKIPNELCSTFLVTM